MKNLQRFIWGIVIICGVTFAVFAQKFHAVSRQQTRMSKPMVGKAVATKHKAKQTTSALRKTPKIKAGQNPVQARQHELRAEIVAEARERYDQPDEAAEYYRLKRLPAGVTEIPVEKYLIAKTQMDAMPQYSTALGRALPSRNEMKKLGYAGIDQTEALGNWTPLGPGNIGGRTRALIIHPTSPQIMYAAGVAGGVWKTTNSGAAWQPLTDLLPNLAVSCLAFDPNNSNVIYAGTGEGFFNSNAVRGAGIFRTTDGGVNWSLLAATGTADFYYVNDIVVSKTNSQRLYAGTRTGVWRSLDGGATWGKVLNNADGCLDLLMRTDQTTDYLFASCGTFGGAEIFRNTDAGGTTGTWTSVQKETGMGRTSLALAPSNQSIIYALSANTLAGQFRDGLYAVFRSSSNGDTGTWIAQVRNNNPLKLNTILLTNPLFSFRSECGLGANGFSNQGWYDNVIAVDPMDANRVWVGGIDLFRSDDGGANWGIASYWWPEKNTAQYVHADQHVIAFHPNYNGTSNKQMFVGNDGGIFRTDDARAGVIAGVTAACNPAASGVRWTSLNNNYGVTQFYHGAVFPDGRGYFGGTQDNGTLLGTEASGTNGWREIYSGDGGYGAIDPANPNVLYASTQNGRFRKSTNGGVTFGDARLGISDTTLFITPLAMDTSDPQRLWTGGTKLWLSENGGANWRDVQLSASPAISAIAVAPHDSNRVLVGTTNGGIRTVSMLDEFASTFDLTPRSGFVSSVAFDPTDRQIVYATYSTFGGNHIWKSTVGGFAWQAIDGTGPNRLPDVPAHCVVVDPTNPNRIFVGTDLGVFVTTDGGNNWAVENMGFANAPVEWLVINTASNVTSLYAFTHGRGVARVSIGGNVCTYSLSATRQSFSVAGGSGIVDVVGVNGCNWTAISNVDWIVVSPGTSGNGNGKVSYSVAPSNFLAKRIGTLTIAGRSFMVIQDRRVDSSPPIIAITSPTTSDTYQVSSTTLSISGTVSDETSGVTMQWVNDRGGSDQIAVNGNQWTAGLFALSFGINQITILARDASGNTSTTVIKIIFFSDQIINAYAATGIDGFSGDGGPALIAQMRQPYDVAVDSQGNVYISDLIGCRIRKVTPNGIISTIAGNGVRASSGDGGLAVNAQLAGPWGIAVDLQGNVYFVEGDTGAIRKITIATGNIATVVTAQQASLHTPRDVSVDKNGNVYIADLGFHRIQKVTPLGVVSTFAGSTGGFGGDGGAAIAAHLNAPNSIAIDGLDNFYISDQGNGRVRKVTKDGVINSIANRNALGLAADKDGNVFVVSSRTLEKILPSGMIMPIIADSAFSSGSGDGGPAIAAKLSFPFGIAVDSIGSLYVVSDNRIRKISASPVNDTTAPSINISTPTSSATYSTTNSLLNLSGSASDNLTLTHVSWKNDRGGNGVAAGTTAWSISNMGLQPGVNNISITAGDAMGNASTRVLAVTYTPANIFSTLVGVRSIGSLFVPGFNLESGSAFSSQLYAPETVSLDNAGNLYIADKGNHRIRKVTRSGLISTVAGSGQLGSSGDGGLALNASLNQPNGVVVDNVGNLYIADTNNHRIRKVNTAGIITTIAGTGISGFAGDNGAAAQAQLNTPVGIILDNTGNLLIADAVNHRVRKLNLSTGIITTIVGNGYGFGGDGGQATQAQLNFPTGVAMDKDGNLYISDTSNHQVRKVTTSGIISRFAGTGFSGFSGDSGQANLAQLNAPGGLTVDAIGNLYITDQGNHRVRKVAVDGTISTVAGTGNTTSATSDEGGTALNASLNAPAGVAIDTLGNLFIADTENHRVVVVAAYKATASVNAANYLPNQPVAVESVVAAFGANLATRDQAATQLPLLTEMAGTSVKVRDSRGSERLAPLFYVGKTQVNYQIPAGTATGFASIIITNGSGEIWMGAVNVVEVQPGVFSASSDGNGPAAASLLFIKGGQRTSGIVANCGAQGCVANPIDVSAYDEVYLEIFGTGIRKNSGISNVTATIGGVSVPVLYAGAHCCFFAVDQVNLPIPKSLAGRGLVEVVLTVEGKVANRVSLNVK